MSRDNTWLNNDGLKVGFGARTLDNSNAGTIRTVGLREEMVKVLVDASALTDTDTAAVQGDEVPIPAGSTILSARFVVITPFATSASGTLDIGVKVKAGGADGAGANDDDAIDAAIAVTAIDAENDVVDCNGAIIGTKTAVDLYPIFTYDTGVFTAGKGYLVVEYERAPAVA